MKLNVSEKIAVGVAPCVAVVLFIIAGSSARGGGGPGFGSQNNPGTQGSQFGQAAASGTGAQPTQGGPGFGPGNNAGLDGSAYGQSTASDASGGRSDARKGLFQSSGAEEEVIDTDANGGKGKARHAGERETHRADATGGARRC